MGYIPGFEPQILEALQSDVPDVKFEAVRATATSPVSRKVGRTRFPGAGKRAAG